MKKILLFILIGFTLSSAQNINWSEITPDYNLPDGVKLYEGERSSPSLKIFYYDVDLNNPDIAIRPYISSSIKTVPKFVKSVGAYGAVNGGYFATGTSNSFSSVVYPGEVKSQNVKSLTRNSKSYPLMRSFFSMKKNGSLSVDWIYHFGADISDIYKFNTPMNYVDNDPTPKIAPQKTDGEPYDSLLLGIGGAPTLVKDSSVMVTYNEEIMWGSGVGNTNSDPRTAVGYTANNHVIMIVANGRSGESQGVSLPELAEIMLGLGCIEAMNLDGGGSSQLAAGDEYVSIPSERPVPTILAIVHKDSLNLPKEKTFEKVIDTGDDDAIETGSGWFETANAGFYGETKSLLHPLGNGDNYFEIKPNLPGSAKYEVYGWWVASSNRCKDTPHIINHANGTDTVFIDQTINGSTWTLIGSYNFNGDSSESVIISDFGTQGDFIVADAVRFVSFEEIDVTDIGKKNRSLPFKHRLSQNYPNPFNPSTKIKFTVFKGNRVNLKVFDMLGKEIKILVDEYKSAGDYSINFNASGLTSGLYFYRINIGDYSNTKVMALLK
ncbi:MAG: phosphodiester glycosidase family protein [Melioribacteraceae bacterium]|nr:phosphodiester glycosidase family protein [Melioribacteraceae bacterium]